MRARFVVLMLLVALSAMLPQAAFAAVLGQETAPGDGNLLFLLAGALAVWAAFFAYAFYLARKNVALRRELEDLRNSLAEKSGNRS